MVQVVDGEFLKLEDDDTCALLKPYNPKAPPVTHVVEYVMNILNNMPEVKKRVMARLTITDVVGTM